MGRFQRLGFFVVCLGLCGGAADAQARLTSGGGRIEVVRQNAPVPAVPNQLLLENDRLRTGNGSFATLELAPGNRIILREQTEVELLNIQTDLRISLERGAVKVLSNSQMVVMTKDGQFSNGAGALEMDLSYRDTKLTLAVASGSVNAAGLTSNVAFAAVNNSPATRTYVSGGHHNRIFAASSQPAYGAWYAYPYIYINPNVFMPRH